MRREELDNLLSFLATARVAADDLDGDAFWQGGTDLDKYYRNHALVYLRALNIVREALPVGNTIKALELGAPPYFFTSLLAMRLDCEVTAVSVPAGVWPGEPLPIRKESVKLEVGEDHRPLDIQMYVLNIGKDLFPFPDHSFDLILCMEVIEHLTYSPTHMLVETHRVLNEDGKLLVTVANAINVKRTVQLLLNQTIEHRYSGYGVYGRHSREYAPREPEALLAACNYQAVLLQTANVWREIARSSAARRLANVLLKALTSIPVPYLWAKREYVFAVAEPVGEPRASYPAFLYDFRHGYASCR